MADVGGKPLPEEFGGYLKSVATLTVPIDEILIYILLYTLRSM